LPWNDGRFGGMVQSAVKEMGQLSGPDDVLFKRYFSRIAHEKGFHDRLLGGEDVEQEVWNAFLGSEEAVTEGWHVQVVPAVCEAQDLHGGLDQLAGGAGEALH
jgi:hypothetical protein